MAVKDKTTLQSDKDSALASGKAGGILASEHRGVVGDNIDSLVGVVAGYMAGQEVQPSVMAVSDGWLGVSNKLTSEPLAPQQTSIPSFAQPDDGQGYNTQQDQSVVRYGTDILFSELTALSSVRIRVPSINNDVSYKLLAIDITSTPVVLSYIPLDTRSLDQNGWNVVNLGTSIVASGTTIRFVLETLNSNSTTDITGGWTWEGSSSNPPASQSANSGGNNKTVRIDKTDLDSVDRSSELNSVINSSTIRFSQTSDLTKYVEYVVIADPVDQGTYVEYTVELSETANGGPSGGQTATVDIEIPIAQFTQYLERTDYWAANPIPYGTATGYLEFGGVPQAGVSDSAFPVDVKGGTISVSADWDLMAYTNSIIGLDSSTSSSGSVQGQGTEPSQSFQQAFWYSLVDQVPNTDNTPETVLFEVAAADFSSDDFQIDPLTGIMTFNFSGQMISTLSFNIKRLGAGSGELLWFGAEKAVVDSPDPNNAAHWVPYGLTVDHAVTTQSESTVPVPFIIQSIKFGDKYRIRMAPEDASELAGLYNNAAPAGGAFGLPTGSCNINMTYWKR